MSTTPIDLARSLAPHVAESAEAVESHGALTPEVISMLSDSGLLWMLVPKEVGGGGASIGDYIDVVEHLSYADGSTGWAFMAASTTTGIAGGLVSKQGALHLFGGKDKAIVAGQLAPMGRATRTADGYRVDGKYQFASGSQFANWMGGGFRVSDSTGASEPDEFVGVFPKSSVQMFQNWDVTGLVGTGSHDYSVTGLEVATELTFSRSSPQPWTDSPLFAFGTAGLAVAGHASVALGLMRRALSELAEVVDGKRRAGYAKAVQETTLFGHEFAVNDARYHAARAYLREIYLEAEATAADGRPVSEETIARMRQAATWTHEVASQVVDFCRLWAGTQSFRNPSRLGRVVRDMNVATQHALIDPITLANAAPALLNSWRR